MTNWRVIFYVQLANQLYGWKVLTVKNDFHQLLLVYLDNDVECRIKYIA